MKTRGWGAVLLAYPAASAVGAAIVAVGFAVVGIVSQVMNEVPDRMLEGLWITPAAFPLCAGRLSRRADRHRHTGVACSASSGADDTA